MTTYEPEPEEHELPVKPEIKDMPPEEGVEPPTDEEEAEVAGKTDFLDQTRAEADDEIDNAEAESYPEED